jgi:hypothetical protein
MPQTLPPDALKVLPYRSTENPAAGAADSASASTCCRKKRLLPDKALSGTSIFQKQTESIAASQPKIILYMPVNVLNGIQKVQDAGKQRRRGRIFRHPTYPVRHFADRNSRKTWKSLN